MCGPHLPALIIPKLSKKASFFANFTCSFDYLYIFRDIPRQHKSLRSAGSLDSTPSTSEHWGEAVDPKGALNPKQHTWARSWCSEEGVTSPSQAISSLPISWWTRWPLHSDFRESIQKKSVFLSQGKGGGDVLRMSLQ